MKNDLAEIPTAQLVEELSKRSGVVNTIQVPMDSKTNFKVEGPAIVLVVID